MGMVCIVLAALLAMVDLVACWRCGSCTLESRTTRVIYPLSKIILFAPLLGIAVFSLLFAFVLKGQLPQRASHALLVFALWMAATQFYLYLLAYYKQRKWALCSGVGIVFSVALAVLFTPLSRYIQLVYSLIGNYAFLLGCGLLGVVYAASFMLYKREKQGRQINHKGASQ